jgi:uncharacterized protein YciI
MAASRNRPFAKWYGHLAREYHGRLGRGNAGIRNIPLNLMGETPIPRPKSISKRAANRLAVILTTVVLFAVAGCQAPTATLDLLTVAQQGLADARAAQQTLHDQQLQQFQAQQQTLDAAFDADVRLVAAGQLTDADGRPVELDPEWIISARKGYSAARDILAQQARQADAAHTIHMDNLDAAAEAIHLAEQLITLQWSLAEPLRQQFVNLRRRLFHAE